MRTRLLERDESPIKRPSNRHLIAVMESWGWRVKRTNGNVVVMKWTENDPDGRMQLAYVNSATFGSPTKDTQVKKIIDITTGGDAHKFWKVVPAPRSDLTDQPRLQVLIADDFPQSPIKTAPKRKVAWEQLTMPEIEPTPEPTPKPDDEEVGAMRKQQERGTAAEVLQVLIKVGQPMNRESVHTFLPRHSIKAIGNALYYLHHVNQTERVLNGTYRVADKNRAGDALHVDGRPRLQVAYDAAPTTSTVPESTTDRVTITGNVTATPLEIWPAPPVPDNWTVQSLPDEATDDMMDAMLDLMFPNGFKATHLSSIASWKNETRKLIAKINA